MDNQVTLTIEEYAELKMASQKLAALEAAGVDNWEGYSIAMESLEGEYKESTEGYRVEMLDQNGGDYFE